MAHAARLGGLTEELVTIITSFSPQNNANKFTRLKDSSLRSLRHHIYGRTNQFDVTSQLDGLVEKFSVHDKDSIADALSARLRSLEELPIKWQPEILHLLLELSDRPVANTRLEDLDNIREPESDPGPSLNWKELVAEDPLLREKHIWRNVDFAADSSEDEIDDTRSDYSDPTTVDSSLDYDPHHHLTRYAASDADPAGLKDLRKAQYWASSPSVGGVKLETVKKQITDLQAVREVLFMLCGLPTSLFKISPDQCSVILATDYTIKTASHEAYEKIMGDFAEFGTSLQILRAWTQTKQSLPLLQVFQSSILKRTRVFDQVLSSIQHRFVSITDDVVVSLLGIRTQVSQHIRPLVRLAAVVQKLLAEPYSHSFRYLEFLFEETCLCQMSGESTLYVFLGTIFFECFQLYLLPLRQWMEEGHLDASDKIFFVSQLSGKTGLSMIWEDQFKLRQSQSGVLHAPSFVFPAANKIFTTGKSVVVLKRLNRFRRPPPQNDEHLLSFEVVCPPDKYLAPFPELFNAALEDWTGSKHHQTSSDLRKILFDSCGLRSALDMLLATYFMADGAGSAAFSRYVYDKLDALDESWRDSFTLTEVGQSTFGQTNEIAFDHLKMKTLHLPKKMNQVAECRKTVKTLSIIKPHYHLFWPIQIIIKSDTISTYQRIFTFLLQIRRTSHTLSHDRLLKDTPTHTSSALERAYYYSLRARLLWFQQTLYYYLTAIVLESLSTKLRQDLKEAEDVDSMIAVHSTFIKMAQDQALLGSKLEVIHKTVLKILDLAIKLHDAQSANAIASKEAITQQQELMDLSMGSLGLHTPRRKPTQPSKYAQPGTRKNRQEYDSSSGDDDDEARADVAEFSILSPGREAGEAELPYGERLRNMRDEFDRLVRFVASGLRGVARAAGREEGKSWDLLGEMLEAGIGSDVRY